MARPQKKGLDYFPLDVNFYGDIKVRRLMRNNGGGKAAFVYVTLLCKIYESGYYMVWDDDMSFMLSDITGFEEGMIRETVKSCLKFGLLDKDMYDQHHILTSRGIQNRYFEAVKRRVRGRDNLPYLYPEILNDSEFMQAETTKQTEFMSTETEFMSTETPISVTESTQKESKVKDKSSLRSNLPSSTSTATSRVRDGDENPKEGESVDVQTVVEELKTDRDWLLSMQRRHGIEAQKVVGWLNAFVVECNCRGTRVHENKSDVMRHFNDWLVKQVKPVRGDKGKATGTTAPNYHKLWVRAKAALCSSVSSEQSAATFDLMKYYCFKPEENKLVVTIPGEEVYQLLESQPYIRLLQVTLRKYFGERFSLAYKLRTPSQSQ